MTSPQKLDHFLSATFDLVSTALGASRLAFYRVNEAQDMWDMTRLRLPQLFNRAYAAQMYQLDPLHVRRVAPTEACVARLDEAKAFMRSEDVSLYVGFLRRHDITDAMEMIFRDNGKIEAGLSIFWTGADKAPDMEKQRLAAQLQRYIELNLPHYLEKRGRPEQADSLRALGLTPREVEVAELVCLGRSNGEIAMILNIGLPTVKTHLIHIFEKCGVESRVALVAQVCRSS